MSSFLQKISCVLALMIPFSAVAAEGNLTIIISDNAFRHGVELYAKGEMKWRGYFIETGIVHPDVSPGTYQLVIRPGIISIYGEEVLLTREVTVKEGEETLIELSLPVRAINLAIDTGAMEHKTLIVRLDGASPETAGVRRWFTTKKEEDSTLWKTILHGLLAGQYRCHIYSSAEDAEKGEEFVTLRLTLPKSDKNLISSYKVVASIVSE